MHIYNFGYHSHEESEYIQLYHNSKFTQKEFEEIVMNSASNIIDAEGGKDTSFEHIFLDVLDDLIKNHGFTKVEFEAEFDVFGWPDIMNKDDWKNERGELLDKLADFIKDKQNSGKNS